MAKKKSVKQLGDENLLHLVGELQKKIAYEKTLNSLAMDQSADNLIASKILHAKYNFLYKEARLRNAPSEQTNSVISQ